MHPEHDRVRRAELRRPDPAGQSRHQEPEPPLLRLVLQGRPARRGRKPAPRPLPGRGSAGAGSRRSWTSSPSIRRAGRSQINEGLLEKILGSFHRASSRLGREITFSLENLFRIPQLIELKRKAFSPEEKAFLESCFLKTIEPLIRARAAEGRKTAAQIKVHLGNVRSAMARVEKLAARQPKAVQKRLRKKMKDVNGSSPASQNRLDEEVAYLTQRYDVAEEIQRLRSHLGAARDLLLRPGAEPAGKMLDFIAQELTREANTLNSKSQDIDMTRQGLLIKGEVESIRQQVQNLE